LETPITEGPEIPDFEMIFRSNPGTEQALKQAGFSVLSLANNHTLNFGEKGLKDTLNYLENVDIKYAGAGQNEQEAFQPVYIEKKDIKFCFSWHITTAMLFRFITRHPAIARERHLCELNKMIEAVKEAKYKADFVIISMHAGIEYAEEPNNSQINFAHAAIDAGADLVIGHHPHVVQTLENTKANTFFTAWEILFLTNRNQRKQKRV